MKFILEAVEKVSETLNVVFVLHAPTEKSLQNYGLLEDFRRICIMMPMQEYLGFLILLKNSTFVMTDGGSIQEESYFLDIPCLVMRSETERKEGLGANIYLAEFNHDRVDWFLQNLPMLKRQNITLDNATYPSAKIVGYLVVYT